MKGILCARYCLRITALTKQIKTTASLKTYILGSVFTANFV